MPKLPHAPRFIVAGPDFRTTSTGSEAGCCARAGVGVSSDRMKLNSRIAIHLQPALVRPQITSNLLVSIPFSRLCGLLREFSSRNATVGAVYDRPRS